MQTPAQLQQRLSQVFSTEQAEVLAQVVTEAYSELVKTSDFNELKAIVRELAQAQNRTEQRLEELAQAQTRTEQRVDELAQALRETNRQVGGLAMTIGYTLENESYKALPALLRENFNLAVQGRLKRGYVTDEQGRSLEVNILGQAVREGKNYTIVGESKSQLSTRDIDRFVRRKLDPLRGVLGDVFPLLVTHMVSSPEVENYAQEQGVTLYYSYDF
ncbi:MAG: hypothetical protein ACFB4I_15245 [Cyanophyceae cyanobacterium]